MKRERNSINRDGKARESMVLSGERAVEPSS